MKIEKKEECFSIVVSAMQYWGMTLLGLFIFIYFFIVITFLIWYKSSCLNLIALWVIVTSEDVCWSIRNVKFINESFYSMHALSGYVSNRSLFDIFTQVEMAEK